MRPAPVYNRPMKYTEAIQSAYEHAGPITWRRGKPTIEGTRHGGPTIRKDQEDDFVTWYRPIRRSDIIRDTPNTVIVDKYTDFPDVMREYARIARIPEAPALANVFERMRVLRDQADIVRQLGGASIHFLRLWADKERGHNVWETGGYVHSLRTSKLGVALTLIYPRDISDSSIKAVQAAGYKDQHDVSARAQAAGLPKPLWER